MITRITNKRLQSYLIASIWWLLAAYFITSTASLTGQAMINFQDVLRQAESQSIFRYQAQADNEIAQSQWAFFKTRLQPGVGLDLLAPNFIKTSREIVQPNGSIAFQSVSQNNSSLSLSMRQQLKSTGGTIFATTQLQRFDDFSGDISQYNGIPIRVGFLQPIFGFNELRWADKIEPLALTEANRKYVIDMENIHLRATIVFFDVLAAKLDEQIAGTNSEVNEKLLDIANERFELGKSSRNDLLQLELEYKNAVKNLSSAAFQVDFAKGALQTFLGAKSLSFENVATPSPLEDEVIIPLDVALEQAKANRPDFIAFERQQLEADRDIRQAEVEFGVQAELFASFGYARGSQKLGDIYTDPISEQQFQLSISIPILDWGRRKAAVGIARAQKEFITQQIAQDQLDFDNDILQAIGNWNQLQREIQLQEEIRDVSLERFEISRERYVLGDISITDLTIAQREKDQAQRTYVETLRNYWITFYQIRRLTAYDFQNNKPITY